VYNSTPQGGIEAFDASGHLGCSTSMAGTQCTPLLGLTVSASRLAPPIVVNGTLYVGSQDGSVHVLKPAA
jgi:PQQ-like domain